MLLSIFNFDLNVNKCPILPLFTVLMGSLKDEDGLYIQCKLRSPTERKRTIQYRTGYLYRTTNQPDQKSVQKSTGSLLIIYVSIGIISTGKNL